MLLSDQAIKLSEQDIKLSQQLKKLEAHWSWLVHLNEIATADMQMLCNIFPILWLYLMKGIYFEQFFGLKKKNVFIIIFFLPWMGILAYGHESQRSVSIWTNSQSRFNSRINVNLVKIGQVFSEISCLIISRFYTCLSHDRHVIQWNNPYHKNHITTRVITPARLLIG